MNNAAKTPAKGDRRSIASARGQGGEVYADRPYEKTITESGRRFISVDLDSSIIEKMDRLRGRKRRGLYMDQLLNRALNEQASQESLCARP